MILTLTGLTKRFSSLRGEIVAADDVTLTIEDRELFVLLGPSGCGKSTILNLIAGLEKPTAGEIRFDDRVVSSATDRIALGPRERNVAMVFQSYALYPHLTVFENIAFPLRIAGMKADRLRESVGRAASTLGISGLLSVKPVELSGGQRQRVAIARAIVRQPSVFLLDEPLSNLDAQLRLATRVELKNLQRALGITTVYVTHDQVEAMSLADRIAVLRDGRIEQVGTPEELYGSPVSPFVATFIGSPTMNLIDMPLVEENGVFFLSIGGQRLRVPEERGGRFRRLSTGRCLFGIRPEDIHVARAGSVNTLRGRIESIELLGRETVMRISLEEERLALLTGAADWREGDPVEVELDLERAHIFEPQE